MDCTDSTENSSGSGSAKSLYLLNKPMFVLGNRTLEGIHKERSAHWTSWERKSNYYRSISELRMDSTTPIFAVEPGMVKVSGIVNCIPNCSLSAVRNCSQYRGLPYSSSWLRSWGTPTEWYRSCRNA